jgi:hypothetical protein
MVFGGVAHRPGATHCSHPVFRCSAAFPVASLSQLCAAVAGGGARPATDGHGWDIRFMSYPIPLIPDSTGTRPTPAAVGATPHPSP